MILFYLSFLLAYDPLFSAPAAKRDPEGKAEIDLALSQEENPKKEHEAFAGNNYIDGHVNVTVSNDIKADMNSPIVPTEEERLIMKNNMAVVMPYLVRPEQLLFLMKHD